MYPKVDFLQGDALTVLRTLPDESVHCCVTSPPYWGLRDYGVDGQIGLEKTPEKYVSKMVEVFREVRRVLREDGTLWLNLGDSYAGYWGDKYDHRPFGEDRTPDSSTPPNKASLDFINGSLKPKDLCGMPWRVAFALQADGWWLRQDIIWNKRNPMPESVTDRCTKAHEYLFLLSKSARYFFDSEAIKEPSLINEHGRYDMARNGVRTGLAYLGQGLQNNSVKVRSPAGWKTGPESHGTIHDNGREPSVTYNEIDSSKRNKRSVWTVTTQPYSEAHFATFPPDLIKPCILAGTSARGCCPKCGAPWERVVESIRQRNGATPHSRTTRTAGNSAMQSLPTALRTDASKSGMGTPEVKTTRWEPSCGCEGFRDISNPCTVLDPFGGSGTTGMVSMELGRKAILIELNPKYMELARKRCNVTPALDLA